MQADTIIRLAGQRLIPEEYHDHYQEALKQLQCDSLIDLKCIMVAEAIIKYGEIAPTIKKKTYDACFTDDINFKDGTKELVFWFNSKDHSTHIVRKVLQ